MLEEQHNTTDQYNKSPKLYEDDTNTEFAVTFIKEESLHCDDEMSMEELSNVGSTEGEKSIKDPVRLGADFVRDDGNGENVSNKTKLIRSRSTNKLQLQQLLSLMRTNPEIARGFFKVDKRDLQRFWRRVEHQLNSLGPPIKNSTDWKKVWTDQKKYVRQKAVQNFHKFSPTERIIYDLIGMKTSVEGIATTSIGLESTSAIKEIPEVPIETNVLDVSMQDSSKSEKVIASAEPSLCGPPKLIPKPTGASTKSANNILSAEFAVQKELLETVKEAVVDAKDRKQSIKKIYRSLDNIYELQKNHFQALEKMKREQIEEMRRHNTFMEEMRMREVEYKLEKKFHFNDLSHK